MGAASVRLARRPKLEAERPEPGVVQVDGERGQRDALLPQPLDARFGEETRPRLDGGQAEDGRRPRLEAADPCDRVVLGSHGELLALGEPAPDRRAETLLELGADVEERGSARPGVEVLVRAADSKVGAGRL